MTKSFLGFVLMTVLASPGFASDSTATTSQDFGHQAHQSDTESIRTVVCKSFDARTELRVPMQGDHVASENRLIKSETFKNFLGEEYTEEDREDIAPGSSLIVDGRPVVGDRGSELYTMESSPQSLGIYLQDSEQTADLARYGAILWNYQNLGTTSDEELEAMYGFKNIRERLARGGYLARLTGYKKYDPPKVGLLEDSIETYLICQ